MAEKIKNDKSICKTCTKETESVLKHCRKCIRKIWEDIIKQKGESIEKRNTD